jgi:tRNA/tmRNA/rRNA uracil-C5-methylase (TrmA/RlmC/RlmD family)
MSSIKDLMDSMLSSENNGSGGEVVPETNPTERVTYLQANAALALYRGQALGANVLIVDPPRKGLDEVVLQQLCQKINGKQLYVEKPTLIAHLPRHTINWTNDVRTLIYVSCGFDALARDLDGLLTSNAGWKIDSATGYVLFPGSNHVETVVVLRR